MKLHMLTMLISSVLLVAVSPSWARKWTDTTGKFSVEAELVEIKDGKVVLKKSSGSVITVPIARLSEADRRYLRSLEESGPKQPPDSGEGLSQRAAPKDHPAEPASADAQLGTDGQAGSPQVIEGDLFRDLDYVFEIRRPSADWEFLSEPKAQQRNPEACMGLVNLKTQGWVVVVVEQVGQVKLEDYAQMVLEGAAFQEGTVLGRKNITLAGKPALELRVNGKVTGLSVSYLFFFVNHEGFTYQLVCGSFERDFARNEADLRRIAGTLRLLPDRRPRLRSVAVATKDQRGVDWRIKGNRYENASFGFRLTIPPRWRFMGRTELSQLGADASAGLVCVNPELYQTYIVEPMPGVKQDRVRKDLQQTVATNLGVEGPDVVTRVTVGGLKTTESVYRDADLEGAKVKMAQTVLFRGNFCFQIATWGVAENMGDMEEARKTYNFLSFVTEQERKKLEKELLRSDPDNSVGETFSLRNGLYRDFQHGFIYKKPPGLWRALTGQAASAVGPGVLRLQSPAKGFYITLIPELVADLPHRRYHQVLLANMEAPKVTLIQTRRQNDLQLLVSQFDRELEGLPFTFVLATAVRGERHVQLLILGLRGNMTQIGQLLPDILAGLDVPAEPPVARVQAGTIVQDFRLGYCLATIEPGWRLEIAPYPQGKLEAVASMVQLSRKDVECIAMGVCVPDLDEEMALKSLTASAGPGGVDPETRKESSDTLAGLPARRISMEGRRLFRRTTLTVWLARRANTMYQFLVVQERGILRAKPDKTAQDYKKFFSLLDIPLVEQEARPEFAGDLAASLNNRGEALGAHGRLLEAIQDFDKAIDIYTRLVEQEGPTELAGELVGSLAARGNALAAQGKLPEAVQDFDKAIAISTRLVEQEGRTDFAEHLAGSLNNLAWLRATYPEAKFRNAGQAVKHATRACELTKWKNPDVIDTLSAAYAEAGDFDAAVKWQTKAIELAPNDQNLDFRSKLDLYQAKKPYREKPEWGW